MCETCNNGGYNRREFLKVSGAAATLGALLPTIALSHNIDGTYHVPVISKNKTKIALLFMYPPDNVVNEGRLEDSWAVNHWFTYPGNQFEPEMNQEKYTKKIVEFAKIYDIDLDFRGVIYTKAAMTDFIAETKAAPPDTLLVVNFWNTFSAWVLDMSRQLAQLPMIVYHPVGSNHQHPPKDLMTAPGMIYIHSLENWDALENAMAAANAKKMMSQSRLLRVDDVTELAKDKDEKLGVEIITVPAAEYNSLFDSIKADEALIREAMAFKARATSVIEVEDKYIIDGFRSRSAVLDIIKRYNADAITIVCLMLKERKPCIAFSLCNSALIPCACEGDIGSALSLMIGSHLFKRGGFQHNPDFDIDRNRYYGSHCTCALEMRGPGKGEIPFRIRPFAHQLPKTAALDVNMPPDERMLVMKYLQNRIFVYAGKIVNSPEFNTAGGCATRFVMDIDNANDVCSTYQSPHPIMYFGSVMEAKRIKAFAKLTKLEFIGNI